MINLNFFIDIHNNEHPKYLVGCIRTLNLDFDKLYDTWLIINHVDKKYPCQKVELFMNKNSKYDDCCYFRIDNLKAFLEQNNILEEEFFIEINIEGQYFRSENTIKYK